MHFIEAFLSMRDQRMTDKVASLWTLTALMAQA